LPQRRWLFVPLWGIATYFCYARSEEHTSELQSLTNLVCRLLLEKTKGHARHRSIQRHPQLLQPRHAAPLPDLGDLAHHPHRERTRLSLWRRVLHFLFFFKKTPPPEIHPFSPPRRSPV